MATTTARASGNPKERSNLNSKPPAAEDTIPAQETVISGEAGDQSKLKSAEMTEVNGGANKASSISDLQKKMKRAERFGMPVQMSEKEKRSSRAERFGSSSPANGSITGKPSEAEQLKRKARAERFGIAQSDPSDVEAKKKARLARFGSSSNTDSPEEAKKKARAIRFSQSDSLAKGDAKENIDVKNAVAGEDTGGS